MVLTRGANSEMVLFLLRRSLNDFFQGRKIDVAEALDVKTSFPDAMFAELLHQLGILKLRRTDVQCEILLARRETNDGPVAGASAGILYLPQSKTHDTAAPHLRLGFGCLLHQLPDRRTIRARPRVGKVLDELIHAFFGCFCLCFSHMGPLEN